MECISSQLSEFDFIYRVRQDKEHVQRRGR